jgi:putative tryptophan/tyrosine transport system substrate-binding protein
MAHPLRLLSVVVACRLSGGAMSTKPFLIVGLALALLSRSAEAQQPKEIARIGYLSPTSLSVSSPYRDAFQQGLRSLGYVEGKNIIVEYRFAEGKVDRIPHLVAELVGLKVDVIVVASSSVARAAKKVTTSVPIVMASGGNPFGEGLIATLARPGGNVTGLTNLVRHLGAKRLELLKESFPGLARVAVLPSPRRPGGKRIELEEMQVAASSLKLPLETLEVRTGDDFERALEDAVRAGVGALAVTRGAAALFSTRENGIVELIVKNRLPAIYPRISYIRAGGLMYYGEDELENYRRVATYVDKILKGASPADLPVEQPTKFESIINLKAAKQIGLTIPPQVLARADKVIR